MIQNRFFFNEQNIATFRDFGILKIDLGHSILLYYWLVRGFQMLKITYPQDRSEIGDKLLWQHNRSCLELNILTPDEKSQRSFAATIITQTDILPKLAQFLPTSS